MALDVALHGGQQFSQFLIFQHVVRFL